MQLILRSFVTLCAALGIVGLVGAQQVVFAPLYSARKVKANYAFKKGKMGAEDITRILADLPKILEEK